MSEAPALPAQTPGMFVGGGGSGSRLSGECAEAVTDCGLSPVDFAPFEQLIEVVRAAHDRCRAYDEARWLAERERSFDMRSTEAQASEGDERRLERRPSTRERHLACCVAAPLVDASFFQRRPGDARTTIPQAVGYDPRRAPAAPQTRGLTIRGAVHVAFSLVRMGLVERDPATGRNRRRRAGSALSADEVRRLRELRIREVLRDAVDEDQPRLRSTNIAYCTRPRSAEAERRELEQVLPEPPQIASAEAPEAHGAEADGETDSDGATPPSERHASGCVAGTADSQQREMQQQVRDDYGDDYAQTERERYREEREAEREHERSRLTLDDAHIAATMRGFSNDPDERDEALLSLRRALVGLARAEVDRVRARSAAGSMAELRRQSLALAAPSSQPRGELGGLVPESGAELRQHAAGHATILDG